MFSLGVVALRQGEPGRAESLLQESLALARRLKSAWWTALIQANLGVVAREDGRHATVDQAIEYALREETGA